MTHRNCSAKSVSDRQSFKQDALLHQAQGEQDLWLAALQSSAELGDERRPERLRAVFLNS
ncbi:hypothetical protein LLE49_03450 [Alicyclobacillus tolerans]|uniref:hypothetical protein n=1 Tax=Alicyclobacillus tolerans TaxID=90970 RepID=UPI001F1AD691|nr:hypothetical protein [Alicyclobacillus tolerans]MCF8563794.1 hypothetical protein [Alicyclobacillus tolerans]